MVLFEAMGVLESSFRSHKLNLDVEWKRKFLTFWHHRSNAKKKDSEERNASRRPLQHQSLRYISNVRSSSDWMQWCFAMIFSPTIKKDHCSCDSCTYGPGKPFFQTCWLELWQKYRRGGKLSIQRSLELSFGRPCCFPTEPCPLISVLDLRYAPQFQPKSQLGHARRYTIISSTPRDRQLFWCIIASLRTSLIEQLDSHASPYLPTFCSHTMGKKWITNLVTSGWFRGMQKAEWPCSYGPDPYTSLFNWYRRPLCICKVWDQYSRLQWDLFWCVSNKLFVSCVIYKSPDILMCLDV